jgi:hypothetical protein
LATALAERFVPFLSRLLPFFEPLAPGFASFFLKRKLKEWRSKGLIDAYKTRIKRLGKYHYKTYVDLDLTSEQTRNILNDLLDMTFEKIKEGFHE